jgi:hypothetical protein
LALARKLTGGRHGDCLVTPPTNVNTIARSPV